MLLSFGQAMDESLVRTYPRRGFKLAQMTPTAHFEWRALRWSSQESEALEADLLEVVLARMRVELRKRQLGAKARA